MKYRWSRLSLLAASLVVTCAVHGGAFEFSDTQSADLIVHPFGYNGVGGTLEPIRVCLDIQANEAMAIQAEPALMKAIATINRMRSVPDHNFGFGNASEVGASQVDFESVILHELLHTLGLGHPNLADESALPSPQNQATKTTSGANHVYDVNASSDAIYGSADDLRGDDINLHWYQRYVDNPGLLPEVIDTTTMARTLDYLPGGQHFAANADRFVMAALGFVDVEAVAHQGARAGESQRQLAHDDVATLRLAQAGADGIAGTADDYTFSLVYSGRQLSPQGWPCEIAVRFDTGTSLATTQVGAFALSNGSTHWSIYTARTVVNPGVNWYFSGGANTQVAIVGVSPEPSTQQQPFNVQVQVTQMPGSALADFPQGIIEVRDGARGDPGTATCSIVLQGISGEIGQCQLAPVSAGSRTLVADYLGYAGFDGGSASAPHVVNGSVAFSTASATPNPAAIQVPVAIAWTLVPPGGSLPAAATGTVTVKQTVDCATPAPNAETCSVQLPANQCSITFQSSGSKSLRLCYSGNAAIAAAQTTIGLQVNDVRATTTTIAAATPNPGAILTPVTVQASVVESPALGGFPAGVVSVRDGISGDPLTATCTITLTGTPGELGACTLVPLRSGSKILSADFAAQGLWAASSMSTTMTTQRFVIARHVPGVSRLHQAVSVGVVLDLAGYPAAPAPTGTITVGDGVDQCTILLPATECLWVGNTAGLRSLTASWPGDVNHPAMTTATVTQDVLADAYPQLLSAATTAYTDSDGASSGSSVAISADGRFVAFASSADQLVDDDSNGVADIFVRDMQTGAVRRASTSTFGVQANGASADPTISANGRYVAFTSLASNLVDGDTNGVRDVFVKDMATGVLVRASLRYDGSEDRTSQEYYGMTPALSADGRYVTFIDVASLTPNDTNAFPDVYVRDLQTGALDLVSSNDDDQVNSFNSFTPVISADGRYVAFAAWSFNFTDIGVAGQTQIYVKDRLTRKITLVSVAADGTPPNDASYERPAISADGNVIAFMSFAKNLGPSIPYTDYRVFAKNMTTGTVDFVGSQANGTTTLGPSHRPSISADGRYVTFVVEQYTPITQLAIYRKDRQTGTVARIDLAPGGGAASAGDSDFPALSADGRFVAFQSAASNLVSGDGNGLVDEFVRDLQTQTTTRVSAVTAGARSDGASTEAAITRDGTVAVYSSLADNLVAGDGNAARDIFLVDRSTLLPLRISTDASGNAANADSDAPAISADGAWVSFRSSASNLVAGDNNGGADIFVKNRSSGAISLVSTSSGGAASSAGTILGPTSLSADGNLVVFRASDGALVGSDNNGVEDVFVKNRSSGAITLVSSSASGTLGNGNSVQSVISDDGTRIAFASDASNLVADDGNGVRDVYVKTLADGSIARASSDASGNAGNGASSDPSISADGRFVAFASAASNLVSSDSNGSIDIFVKDFSDGSITRVNTTATGVPGSGGDCATPSISSDGRYVGFVCAQPNLVAGDSNGVADVFVKDRQTGAIARLSLSAANVQADAASTMTARALADAGVLVFGSNADNLVTGNAQRIGDVYLNRFANVLLPTTTAIVSQVPSPAPVGAGYTVSVTVTRSAGTATPGGSVTIGDGSTYCTATLAGSGASAGGQCSLAASILGIRNISASYSGDASFAPSSATATQSLVDTRVPTAPSIGVASAGNASAVVYFQPPASEGGSPITSYTAACGSATQNGATAPIVVAGLANGTPVTCSVYASNLEGNGAPSMPSNTVTPATTPGAPTAVVATRGNAQVSVVFAAPGDSGGSAILDYTAYCGGRAQTASASPISVSGLSNGVAVSCIVIAHNGVGRSAPSAASNTVTPATFPDAPAAVTATRGNAQVSVAFVAPADNGSAILGYTAQCGGASQSGSAAPIVVSGLSNGVAVTCTVSASNAIGAGAPSAPSNSVTPATTPDAPHLIAVAPSSASLHLLFSGPAQNGGSPITSYGGSCTPGTHSTSGAASPLTVSGLNNGTLYTCTVTAVNDVGPGIASNVLAATPQSPNSMSVSISSGSDFLRGGASVSYLIDVSNTGSDALSNVHVVDTLGAQLGNASWICSGSGGASCSGTGSGGIDTLVTLPPSARVSFVLTATVATLPETPISNTVTATAPDGTVGTATDGPDAVGVFRDGFQ